MLHLQLFSFPKKIFSIRERERDVEERLLLHSFTLETFQRALLLTDRQTYTDIHRQTYTDRHTLTDN